MNKTNDMLLETLANPNAKTYDFLNNGITSENTQLLDKSEYKRKDFIKEQFTQSDGKFDEQGFDNAYAFALHNLNNIANDELVEKMDHVQYDPFDLSRPVGSKTWNVDVKFSKDINPYEQLYSRDSINSITESVLSLREIAQKGRVHDLETDTWSESINKAGLFTKVFGDTLVYAQWDDDGFHTDPVSGNVVNHKKGDWKIDDNGKLYLEKLGNREIYGKQVVNPSDILTTDGSVFNKFDFFDSDGREKSIPKAAIKTIVEIAPLLIPGVNTWYGGTRAAISLASVMPTFYKSVEGWLLGDNKSALSDPVTKAEGWMAKFNQTSSSDAGAESFWNFEQMSTMVTDIFSQIYEQRAMASLSKYLMRPDKMLDARVSELQFKALQKSLPLAKKHNINVSEAIKKVIAETPDIQQAFRKQSQLSKALSLGYMALTSTGDVYGEAIESGYDRRTAGFAALLTASGQYGIMMNNRMGDWFLDKTTGYNVNVNRALMSKSVKPWLKEINEVLTSPNSVAIKRTKLAEIARSVKKNMNNLFSESSIIGEAMLKNSIIEGIEEVTEQVVQDASKGIIDLMNYLGLTKGKGDFRTIERYATGEAFQEYLANFVGGILGGGLFELERSKISPWMMNRGKVSPEIRKSIYELVANGHKDDLIREVKKQAKYLTNDSLSYIDENGDYKPVIDGESQADLVTTKAIEMINALDHTFNSEGLNLTDNEIINKALRNQVILTELDNFKSEGKHVGIEGLILDDFRNNALEISKIKDEIISLEKIEGTEEQIKAKKEQLRPLIKRRDDILSGDLGMEYFDQIAVLLNPEIKELFGSLDKETFVKAKYGKSFLDLPLSGEGVTRESVDQEWQDFLDSTDMKSKLKTITEAYKSLEATLNPTIAQYTSTGYDILRKQVYDTVIDLNRTIQQFNTATDPAVKAQLLDNFIKINNDLEQVGALKVTPWDVLNYDAFDNVFKAGLVKKSDFSNYSNQELQTVQANGLTLLENIKTDFNEFSKLSPINPLDMEAVIERFNYNIDSFNADVDSKINKLRETGSTDPDVLKQLSDLELSRKNYKIDSLDNTPEFKAETQKIQDAINVEIGNATSDPQEFNRYKDIYNNPIYNKTFQSIISEINPEASTIEDLSDVEINTLIETLQSTGAWSLAKDYFTGKESEEVIRNAELGNINVAELQEVFKFISDNINSGYDLLQNEALAKAYQFSIDKQLELEQFKQNNKPEFFKLKNVSFDFLMNHIEQGLGDKELYDQLKLMFEEVADSFIKVNFPGMEYVSYEDLTWIINNRDKFIQDISDALEPIREGHVSDGPLSKFEDHYLLEDKSFLKELMFKNFPPSKSMEEVLNILIDFDTNFDSLLNTYDIIPKFLEFEKRKPTLKSNPLYDFIRNFSLTLNSNPENKVNKIFDILEKEERLFRATSGASNFSSDNIRETDINQAINTLQMIAAVVNAMSTTSYYDGDLTGFIAMRQQYARQSGISDDVLNLSLLTSDQAAVMVNDLNRLIVKLQFMKDLSTSNSLKMSVEHEIIRNNMNHINVDLFENLAKNTKLSEFIPKDFETIFQSKNDPEKKLIDLEESFYRHNKNQKHKALEAILKYEYSDEQNQRVDVNNRNNITKDTGRGEITPYTKVIYLTTVLSSSVVDFQLQYMDTLSNRLDKAPFYMQELAARMIKASTEHPDLFAKIYELKRNDDNDWGAFLTIVLGGAGTGKTTAVSATVLDILRQTNDSSKVILAAPNADQATKFERDMISAIGKEKISFNSLDKKSLFSLFGSQIESLWSEIDASQRNIADNHGEGKLFEYKKLNQGSALIFNLPKGWDAGIDFNSLPNLLVIDEITHFSTAELVLLNAISEKSYRLGHFMKIVGLGDQNQMGFQIEDGKGNNKVYTSFNINSLNATFTPTLMTSVRATNDQKRLNTDLVLGLVNESIKIYDKHNSNESLDAASIINKANTEFESNFLMNNKQNSGLKYYLKDNDFKGDYIQTDTGDLSVINAIKKQIDDNPDFSLGILTLNGKIDPIIEKLLQDVGIEDFKTYTTNNIQGSESDFFIFNTDVIKNYDKTRDFIKSFYTYMSRSRIGSLIIDPNNILQSKYNITNSQKSQYFVSYEPLTKSVINNIKSNRIDKIKELIGNAKLSDDLFKWKSGEIEGDGDGDGSGGDIDNDIIALLNKLYNSQDKKYNISVSEFKPMLHSFYNNFNTEYTNGIIRTNPEGTPTDLNGHRSTQSEEESNKIIKQWGNLKSKLLFSKISKVTDPTYEDYFKHIFKNYSVGKPVNVELKLTLSKYNNNVNSAQLKFGSKQENSLKENEPFINLSAKLNYEGNVHYVTLSTFAKESTLINAIANISEKGLSDDDLNLLKRDKAKLITEISEVFSSIRGKLKDLSNQDIIDLADLDNSDLEIITSTRVIETENESGQKDNFTLVDLQEKFLGLNISELRIFPADKNSFKNLYKKYTFGDPISDENLDKLYSDLHGKPYVVVSFNNDLEGHESKNVSARIIPVKSQSRSLEKINQEVKILYDDYTKSINQHYKQSSDPMVFDEELDSKTQMLLGRTNILDLLIVWANIKDNNGKSVIDLLIDTIDGDTETSVLDVTNRFRESNETTNQLQQVIQHVKDVVNLNLKSPADTKAEIIKRISGNTAWNRSFYNLFVYKDIIKDAKAIRQSSQNKTDDVSERKGNLLTDEQYDAISKNLDELFSYVQDFNFYYNIPIKSSENGYIVDPKVDGRNGFNNSLFHNKFYINLTPESPRILLSKNKFLDIPKTINKGKPEIKPTSTSLKEFYVNFFYANRGFSENITNPNNGWFKVHSIKDNEGAFSVNVNSLDGIKEIVNKAPNIIDFGTENQIDVNQIVDYSIESDGKVTFENGDWKLTKKPIVKLILQSEQNTSSILDLSVTRQDGSIIASPLQSLGNLNPDDVGQPVIDRINSAIDNYLIDNELNNLQNIQTFLARNLGIGYDNQTMNYSAMPIVKGLVGDNYGQGEYSTGQPKLINILKIAKDLANKLNQCK